LPGHIGNRLETDFRFLANQNGIVSLIEFLHRKELHMPLVKERPPELNAGPEPFSDDFAATPALVEGRVEVIHGVYAHSLPLAGMAVRVARTELEERMNIDPTAIAVVDGIEVDENYVLREGQVLNFVKPAGEKG
jgi:hypothetical protein